MTKGRAQASFDWAIKYAADAIESRIEDDLNDDDLPQEGYELATKLVRKIIKLIRTNPDYVWTGALYEDTVRRH